MTIRQGVNYGPAEARGQLRQWKKKLAKDYAIFDNALEQMNPRGRSAGLAIDMVKCTRSGRKQAFDKINKAFGPGVTLESVTLGKNSKSLAIWSILKPRDAVTIAVPEHYSESERESLAQDCVTVNYVLIGCAEIFVAEGLWTLEVPDHALGRAVERSGFLHPGALIREAHLTLLNLPATILQDPNFQDKKSGIYIKAGNGCFAGHMQFGSDVSDGDKPMAHVRVKTWLDQNQLSERQVILSEKGEPGKTLGDSILKPRPLRRIIVTGNKLEVYTR